MSTPGLPAWKHTFKTMFDPRTVAKSCLAQAVYFEARSESVLGQLAVATVILNRAKAENYPSSICGVVYQGASHLNACQFSFACDGQSNLPQIDRAWETALAVTALALSDDKPAADCCHRHLLPRGLCDPVLVQVDAPPHQDRPPHLLFAGLIKTLQGSGHGESKRLRFLSSKSGAHHDEPSGVDCITANPHPCR